ncbi:13163_t:CDS:2 [Funneliformis geosporum]|uniref:5801_t:CDS:1 n=1 Tax=Funneliformis geosporum TaxID=1117311 RepID=A0A9W4SGL2_9GLOM|nr:5801_t:CDS:2 [Funneliformis geosporum]CAI2183547.1 13163_t:CDS:2 [Funneliformis geosporum]
MKENKGNGFIYHSLIKFAFVTIAVGAPLENAIINPIIKRATIETTLPNCPQHHPDYKASLCFSMNELMVYCQRDDDPDQTIIIYQACESDEICIEHYHAVESDLDVPHATCINYPIRKWDNFADPITTACSVQGAYSSQSNDIEIAIMVYASDGKPIQVYVLYAKENDSVIDYVNDQHNYTSVLQNYHEEKIQYCFNTGSSNKVTAYAAAWGIEEKAFLSSV